MPNNNGSTPEEDDDSDECDVYVSPSHFVGRTPGRKATKQKIFEEQHSTQHDSAQSQSKSFQQSLTEDRNDPKTSHPVYARSVKYTIEHDQSDNDSNHILIARNSFLSQLYLVVNYILVLSSLYLVSLSIWVLFGQDKQGLNAFIPIGGAYLRSLTAYGLCFLFAGTSVLLNSIFIGLENNRPGIVNGFKKETERKHFLYSQVISGAIVLLLTLILFATIPPLSTVLSSGVSDTTWRNMATQYPQSVCAFQVAKNCAGAVDYICMSPNARSTSVSCPGHHCADSCRFLSRRPVVHARACQNCETLSSSTLLQQCKSTEARLSSSRNCIEPLVRVVRHFYLITLISACIVMFFTIIAMSAAMVGFLCSN